MRRLPLIAIALLVSTSPVRTAPPSATQMAGWLPADVNAVVVVQVGELLNTPRATREHWGQPGQMVYLAGAVPVNPAVERIVIGSRFELGRVGQSGAINLLALKQPPDLKKLAGRIGGEIAEV